jgi:hypothetical protein
MRNMKKDAQDFYEAMPGTMDSPAMWQGDSDKRGMLALLLLPLAIIGGLTLFTMRRRSHRRNSDSNNSQPEMDKLES